MNGADTAWVLASAALVMVMTPGLAFFYGGMVRSKSVLNMLMMSFICLGVVTVLWGICGFGFAFGRDLGGVNGPGLLGTPDWFLHGALHGGFSNLFSADQVPAGCRTAPAPVPASCTPDNIPMLAFAMFQLMFAVLTVALISGAVAERVKFGGWAVFVCLWSLLVYFPIAHWVFAPDLFNGAGVQIAHGGWLHNAPINALDFAGGTTVHMNAGAAALALALVVRERDPEIIGESAHNVPFILLGASLLWFGWYGFNAGSALIAGGLASIAFTNTTLATAAAVITWVLVQQVEFRGRRGRLGWRTRETLRPSVWGAASGAVAGLVAITPACAFVAPEGALVIGIAAGAGCQIFVASDWKTWFFRRPRKNGAVLGERGRWMIDDTLDVVGIHLVGGLIGTLLIGFLATKGVNSSGADGLFYGGKLHQLWRQAAAAGSVLLFSFTMTYLIARLINRVLPGGLRVPSAVQTGKGIDWDEHNEVAYDLGG